MKSVISLLTNASILICIFSITLNSPLVFSFTILESGQRIVPVKRSGLDSPTTSTAGSEISSLTKVKTTGLLDLPAIERWAQFHNIKEHHIKTLYRVLLRQKQSSSIMPVSEDDTNTNNAEPLQSLQLYNQLLESDFPQKAASSLFYNNEGALPFNFNFIPCTSKVIKVQPSQSGGFKMVIQLQSGQMVETVIIRHDRSMDESSRKNSPTRYTVCVSSQVGCARACTFCATGTMGLLGQLSSSEILEQVWHAKRFISTQQEKDNSQSEVTEESATNLDASVTRKRRSQQKQRQNMSEIRNVVFMGMGEPLDNYDAVLEACRGLTHQCLFGLKARQVTISTVGATPSRIRWLAEDAPSISLALSLHGATKELREELIPSAKRVKKTVDADDEHEESKMKKNVDSLLELGKALDYHAGCTGKGAMIEYLLIDGVNDSDAAADALGQFCLDRQKSLQNSDTSNQKKAKTSSNFVNLIPYNPTLAGDNFGYETPSNERIDSFCSRLRENYEIRALVRWSSAGGRDANGACGQLALTTSTE